MQATLISYNRINGSNMGNPNFEVVLCNAEGDYIYTRSSSNTSWCYSINDKWLNQTVEYTTTKSGRVNYMKVVA